MKKAKSFKVLFHYLKDDKLKVVLYLILVILTHFPPLIGAVLWGRSVEFLIDKDLSSFSLFFTIWVLIYILSFCILQIPRDKLYNYFEVKFMNNISKDLYMKIDKLPSSAFEDIGVGEFVNRLYSDVDRIMSLLNNLIKLLCKSFVIIFVLYLSFSISIVIGLEMILFIILMGIISFKFFPKIKKTQEKVKKESDSYVKHITENITGIREIKSLGIKDNIEKNVFKSLDTLYEHEKKIRNYEVWYYSINNFCYFALEFLILFTAGKMFIEGKIIYAMFAMLDAYIWRVDEVVESLADFGVDYNKVVVSLNRLDELLNNRLYSDEIYGANNLTKTSGIIEFKDVSFKYQNDDKYTLNNLSLKIVPHKKIAIVGKSGNGKSTIFNLLLRYFDASMGEILIDGVNIKDLTEKSLRENISIIRQSPFLFNMSIMDNFKLIKEDVTLDEVRNACKKSYIDDYIMNLPLGYDTIIGEGGVNLSGGQKQRIAIARTLLLNRKIILFDEATSALDNVSQEYIKKTIDELVKDHTILIVAHRLSTIIDADIIYVVDKGCVISSGKHKDLLKNCKVYQKLYDNEQF